MRSKWIRYSSSSAPRSPCWARSTSARTRCVSLCFLSVAASDTLNFLPGAALGVTLGSGAEADAALAREPLDEDDLPDGARVSAVLGFEGHGRVVVAGEGAVEVVGDRRRDVDGQHLLALERDLE